MTSVDMQDAYFHIPIHRDSRKFLRFVYGNKVFQFRALCFGLSTAPQVSTRVLALLAKWLYLMGIKSSLYLDDWLLQAQSREKCSEDLQKTLLLAQDLGLMINFQKSQLIPSQWVLYLGMIIGSRSFRVSPSPKRIKSCLNTISRFLLLDQCSANEWMILLGTLSSIEQFVFWAGFI